jgi:hypothetical protein
VDERHPSGKGTAETEDRSDASFEPGDLRVRRFTFGQMQDGRPWVRPMPMWRDGR